LKKQALLYCSLLFFSAGLYGQLPDYDVQKLPGKNGLMPPNQAENMIRDHKGFLWLLAPTKAQRFDGKNILSFSFEDRCLEIQEDEQGRLWVISRQNIYRYKNEYEGFEKLTEYTSLENKYRSLLQGPGKKLYLLTTEGILRWNPAANKMEPMGIPPFKSSSNFALLESCGDWLFYRLSENTVVRYNTVSTAQDSVHVQEANYLVPIDEDNVWMRQGIGSTVLVSFKTKKVSPVNKSQFDETFTDNNFFILGGFAGLSGEFFTIIAYKGYYKYSTAENRFTKINLFYNGLPLTSKPLISLNNFLKENNGAGWLATEDGFINFKLNSGAIRLLRSHNITAWHQPTAVWNNDIRNFAEDDKGNIWFGTANGFCKWDKTNGKVSAWTPNFTATNYLNYPSVKSIGFANGKIIVGQSEKGFWIFDPATQTFKRPQFEADSIKIKFEKTFNSNMLMLAGGNFLVLSGGVWLLDPKTFLVKQLKVPTSATYSRKAYEDAQGRIWMLGRNGITAFDKNFQQLYGLDDIERGKWYNAIVQINEETFWVAAKGLFEIKLQPQKQLSIRPVFPEFKSQHFSNLFKDSLGHIWMCNDEGIYRYVPEKNVTEKFEQSDNVQDFNVSVSNSFLGSDGTVYFGSQNGITYFVPEKIPLQNDSLQGQLLNITVNKDDSSFLLHHSLQNLKHSQNTLTFDFISPYLYNAEKIQYRYKLEGADNDWVNLGNTSSIRFNSLQPGKYAFQVAASLNGKDWFATPSSFAFVINPPFWKTWWFILLLLLAIAALVAFLIKRRIQFIKKREAEKTELQKLKTASYQAQLETEQVINYFATSISGQNTVEEMLSDVAKNLIGKMGFEDCMIYLWNPDKTMLSQKAGYGIKGSMQTDADKNKYNVPKGKGIVGATAQTKQSLLVNDTSKDSRYFTVDGIIRLSELCVPIMHNNETLGVINTEHTEKDFYNQRHLHILTTIASLCADKIDTIKAEQQTREKELEVLKLNKDLATSQLTALRAQMNPHFIFNALNSVQQYILQGNVIEANRYLSKFSKLQREILNYSSQNFIPLQKELETLQLYLELEQLRFGENFSFSINKEEIIDEEEIKIPPMIIQPFIENAIWHGLMPKTGDRFVKINFALQSDDQLVCTITDNGIGREAAGRLRQAKNNETAHKSKGLSLVDDRLNILQVQYGKPFNAAITDLVNKEGISTGTQVVLTIYLDF
jgi:putative methionine-R-sulfoxide reductase with GAF domain